MKTTSGFMLPNAPGVHYPVVGLAPVDMHGDDVCAQHLVAIERLGTEPERCVDLAEIVVDDRHVERGRGSGDLGTDPPHPPDPQRAVGELARGLERLARRVPAGLIERSCR